MPYIIGIEYIHIHKGVPVLFDLLKRKFELNQHGSTNRDCLILATRFSLLEKLNMYNTLSYKQKILNNNNNN